MRKILIVDSDEQITSVIGLKLRKENFEVKTEFSAFKALELLKEFKPDLIISEMVLDELSGVDFLKRVKINPRTTSIPFIFLSNSRNLEDKIIAHEMGAEAFFMKPIFIKVLINRIKDFFEEKNFHEMISSKETKSFSGDLTSVSVIDILNIISENRSSGEVTISSSASNEAKIFFDNGAVIRIETGAGSSKNGIEELFNILSWLDGNFVINYKNVSVVRNVNISHDKLVMRAVNWFEGYSGELSEMPPTDSALFVDFGHFFNNINKFPDGVSEILKNVSPNGSSILSIIDNTPFDKRQTVKYLKKMIETGVLTIEKKETPVSIPPRPVWLSQVAAEEEVKEEVKEQSCLSEESISPFNDLDLSESENIPEEENTLVPPPSFAKKDTLDPALNIKFDIEPQEESVHNSININIDILEGNYLEDKTEIVKSVHPDEVSAASREDIKKHLSESYTPKKPYFKILIIFIFTGAVLVVHMYFPEKLRGLTSFFIESVNSISKSEEVAVTEPQAFESKEEIPQKGRDVVLTENQQKLAGYSVSDLIFMSAKYFEEENYPDAVDANKVALYKLKVEKIAKGAEYEKVMTNMAIFLYTDGKYEEALEFAEESILLRDDEKGVELKAAILEELKRPAAAASLFRTKLNDEKFAHKKEEWMMEINRLENITK